MDNVGEVVLGLTDGGDEAGLFAKSESDDDKLSTLSLPAIFSIKDSPFESEISTWSAISPNADSKT